MSAALPPLSAPKGGDKRTPPALSVYGSACRMGGTNSTDLGPDTRKDSDGRAGHPLQKIEAQIQRDKAALLVGCAPQV